MEKRMYKDLPSSVKSNPSLFKENGRQKCDSKLSPRSKHDIKVVDPRTDENKDSLSTGLYAKLC